MSAPVASMILRSSRPSIGDESEVVGVGRIAASGEHGRQLQVAQTAGTIAVGDHDLEIARRGPLSTCRGASGSGRARGGATIEINQRLGLVFSRSIAALASG
jgi:hypothetical protein